MSIYKKLSDARTSFRNSEIKKTGHNSFSKIDYFQLKDFIHVAEKSLTENGLIAVVSFGIDIATLTVHDFDSEATIVVTSPMSNCNLKGCHEVQNLGAVQTYIRRYLWVALFEIIEQDAVDSAPPAEPAEIQIFKETDFKDLDGLKNALAGIWRRMDKDNQKIVKAIYEVKKKQLEKSE
jgi:hypothetical protein